MTCFPSVPSRTWAAKLARARSGQRALGMGGTSGRASASASRSQSSQETTAKEAETRRKPAKVRTLGATHLGYSFTTWSQKGCEMYTATGLVSTDEYCKVVRTLSSLLVLEAAVDLVVVEALDLLLAQVLVIKNARRHGKELDPIYGKPKVRDLHIVRTATNLQMKRGSPSNNGIHK